MVKSFQQFDDHFIVVKYKDPNFNHGRTYEVFEKIEDMLAYVAQETKAGSLIAVFKFGECIGDFS